MAKNVPFPKSENYIPLNDYPVVRYKKCRTKGRHKCIITGEELPRFSLQWHRWTDYLIRDEIYTNKAWLSEKGYILEKLKGNI